VVAAPSCLVSPGRRERTSAKTCSTTTVTTSSQSSNSYSLSCVATKCFRLDRAVVVDEGSPPWKGKLTQRARSLPLLSSAPVQTWRSCEGLLVPCFEGPASNCNAGPVAGTRAHAARCIGETTSSAQRSGRPCPMCVPCDLVLPGEELCRQLPRARPHVLAADSTHPSHVWHGLPRTHRASCAASPCLSALSC